ncbi:hypothetical protein, partial [Elizabethkingia anophelis]|uniref:hypothetical protein n=1 Tax=Elizabethkingia anophelis TaxID=1117645 RepID=UPI001C87D194
APNGAPIHYDEPYFIIQEIRKMLRRSLICVKTGVSESKYSGGILSHSWNFLCISPENVTDPYFRNSVNRRRTLGLL